MHYLNILKISSRFIKMTVKIRKQTFVLLVSVLLLSVQNAGAQNFKSMVDKASFGIKGGINLADMIASPSHQIDMKILGAIGVYSRTQLTEEVYFQPELLLSLQGGMQHTFAPDITSNEYVTNETLTYLVLPLMVQYQLSDKLYLEAGPQLGFRLAAKNAYKILDDQGNVTYESNNDTKKSRRFFDLGINIGFGYTISDKLTAGMRYNYGISPLNVTTSAVKLHNSVIQIAISYLLPYKVQ